MSVERLRYDFKKCAIDPTIYPTDQLSDFNNNPNVPYRPPRKDMYQPPNHNSNPALRNSETQTYYPATPRTAFQLPTEPPSRKFNSGILSTFPGNKTGLPALPMTRTTQTMSYFSTADLSKDFKEKLSFQQVPRPRSPEQINSAESHTKTEFILPYSNGANIRPHLPSYNDCIAANMMSSEMAGCENSSQIQAFRFNPDYSANKESMNEDDAESKEADFG